MGRGQTKELSMASRDLTRRTNGDHDPLAPFRAQFDRLFDDFFGTPAMFGRADFNPAVDVRETDKELIVAADLPGMSDGDIDLEIEDDMLTIRGERREETDDKENRHLFERRYGRFERSMRLPFSPRENAVKAAFKDGVLTVTITKPPEAERASRKIAIDRN
jgi:HSP20 family protein